MKLKLGQNSSLVVTLPLVGTYLHLISQLRGRTKSQNKIFAQPPTYNTFWLKLASKYWKLMKAQDTRLFYFKVKQPTGLLKRKLCAL